MTGHVAHHVRRASTVRSGSARCLRNVGNDREPDGQLGRSTSDLAQLLDDLDDRDISLRIPTLGVDTATPAGRLVTGPSPLSRRWNAT